MNKSHTDITPRTFFALDVDAWRAFNRALDRPPLPNERLKALMARKPPWREERVA